ncbi:MAG: hypothetical protein HY770_02165 [Chitinivibrionia bacterium]|nr:hypothetical protein [Chitinivibrionia bacterium]
MSAQRFTPDIIARAELLISRIQGVCSAKISADETGEITEVHVVAMAAKSPKLVARDVETCLKAELGIHVDHRKIGVVLYDRKEPESPPARAGAEDAPADDIIELPVDEFPSRFVFQSVNLFISHDGVKAEVELVIDGTETFGSARSDNSPNSQRELVAEATVKAVSEFLDEKQKLCLVEVLEIPLGDEDAVVVRVDLIRDRERKSLAGCSIVSGDINQTVVFATLDAINRVMGKLRSKGSIEYKIE